MNGSNRDAKGGAEIARQLGFDESVAAGIRSLDEHWNGKGKPSRLCGSAIPLNSRIALLSQVVDVFHKEHGRDVAIAVINARSFTWFDPELVNAFNRVQHWDEFWAGLADQGLQERVVMLEPAKLRMEADEECLDRVSEAFARVIDAKSAYTYGHSNRVAAYAKAIAEELGLPRERTKWIYRGALLHDIGKLGVSNAVLDKPGSLEPEEWEQVKSHASYTEQILARLSTFSELAMVAGAHHERLDGKGYPRGMQDDEIKLETRVITVADIFDAITADRPYRRPIPIPQALETMERLCNTCIDRECFNALKNASPWQSHNSCV